LAPLHAHNHSDHLQLLLSLDGVPILVDPGTYCYYGEAAWRDYFRSSAAHNVCWWDGADHGRMRGRFLWDRVCDVTHDLSDDGAWMGALRRPDGTTWQRTVRWIAPGRVTVTELVRGSEYVSMAWQFGPDVDVLLQGASVEARVGSGVVDMVLPDGFEWRRLRGSVDPIGGWYSPGFGSRAPSVSLVGRGRAREPIHTTISLRG
jgi:hypothetical protein